MDALRGGVITGNSWMLVVRLKKDGTLAIAKPCQKCMNTLRSVGIKRVKYSTEDGNIITETL